MVLNGFLLSLHFALVWTEGKTGVWGNLFHLESETGRERERERGGEEGRGGGELEMTLLEPSGEHDERLLRFVVRHPFCNTEEITSSAKRFLKGVQ